MTRAAVAATLIALSAVATTYVPPQSDQVRLARAGAADCSASLWGHTESDAADVAECVDAAIARAFRP